MGWSSQVLPPALWGCVSGCTRCCLCPVRCSARGRERNRKPWHPHFNYGATLGRCGGVPGLLALVRVLLQAEGKGLTSQRTLSKIYDKVRSAELGCPGSCERRRVCGGPRPVPPPAMVGPSGDKVATQGWRCPFCARRRDPSACPLRCPQTRLPAR